MGDDLEFHSPYGLLGLQLKGSATVGSIELTGNNNEDLVGHYEIGSDTVFVANGEKTITLTFGTGGLVLDENTIDTVYFVLPAGVFAGGFTAVVKNTTNDVIDNLTTTNNNTIRRERIRMMSIKTLAEVQTEDPSAITSNSVTLHGSVVYEGPVGDIQAHGFSYSTNEDFEAPNVWEVPVTDWDNAKGTYTFHKVLESLPANTHFYYRAYFNLTLDPATMEYGGIKEFTTTEQTYTITVSANPSAAGTVDGAGTYTLGQSHTVTATANPGYAFVNWTEGGTEVSTNANYQFTVTGNRTLQANFVQQHTIAATANPTDGGGVTGGGTYNQGASCTLTATANEGYTFTNWTEGGTEVSTNANYQFTVTGNRTLQANFAPAGPVGAIGFPFSVSETQQVYFSKGNLQYIGSAGNGDANNTGAYWKFADHQWDRLGNNGQGGGTKQLDRDLFGWGVSGYNHGASAYQPWSTSTNNTHYYVYGNSDYHLYSQTGMADWGYNAIINGGNQENSGWRTLTDAEFNYVFYQRPAGLRNLGKVNNVNGLILLPDNWTLPEGVSFNSNWNNSFTNNVYDVEQWAKMEENGAVFLPCNGYRKNVGVVDVETRANYWTSYNPQSPTRRYCMCFIFYSTSAGVTTCDRYYGLAVRLVRNVE